MLDEQATIKMTAAEVTGVIIEDADFISLREGVVLLTWATTSQAMTRWTHESKYDIDEA